MANIQNLSFAIIVGCVPMVKFAEAQNILDVLLKYEILEFCRFGFNRRKFLRTKTLDILPKNQISANYRYIERLPTIAELVISPFLTISQVLTEISMSCP